LRLVSKRHPSIESAATTQHAHEKWSYIERKRFVHGNIPLAYLGLFSSLVSINVEMEEWRRPR
jgi:hypothetical protein